MAEKNGDLRMNCPRFCNVKYDDLKRIAESY